ncbi:MAG: hypothetical protein R2880_10125 [Deinococcales bacterium]
MQETKTQTTIHHIDEIPDFQTEAEEVNFGQTMKLVQIFEGAEDPLKDIVIERRYYRQKTT